MNAWANASRSSSAGSEVFYDLRHQTIFEPLAEMYDAKEAIDLITLQQRLKDKQPLEAGRRARLSGRRCPTPCPPRPTSSYYLEIVREKYLAAENDPHLHRSGRPGLRARRRSGRAAGRSRARHPAHQRSARRRRIPTRSRTWSKRRSTRSRISISARACSPAWRPASPIWTK